jgi:hypothetical protein
MQRISTGRGFFGLKAPKEFALLPWLKRVGFRT